MTTGTRYRLVGIDLDGTLLDSRNRVPPANRSALHRAHQAGLRIAICTGRNYAESRPALDEIGLETDAVVTVFGAVVCQAATGRPISVTSMDRQVTREVIGWMNSRQLVPVVTHPGYDRSFDSYVISSGGDGAGRKTMDRWKKVTGCRWRQVDEWPADAPAPVRISSIAPAEVAHACAQECLASFRDRLVGQAIFAPNYGMWVLEFFAPTVSKWTGLLHLAKVYRIAPQEIACIGDDVNDLAMIRQAGLGIAMANAHPSVKDVADRLAPSNDDCGVAAAIEQILGDARPACAASAST